MLTTYRRHLKNCEHRTEGRKYRRCKCPIWMDGFLGGHEIRKSLDTRDWQKAQDLIREWEAKGMEVKPTSAGITIASACESYVADAIARGLAERTVYKFRLLFQRMKTFADDKGLRYLAEMDTPTLLTFRASWKDRNLAAVKKLERLRGFFRFCVRNKWITENPTANIQSPKAKIRQTLPFARDEMIQILAEASKNIDKKVVHGRENAQRLRVLLLLLRYSGLRIGDAVSCSVDRLRDNKLKLHTQKTGQHVTCPLPEFVVRELAAVPMMGPNHWFWTGNGKLQTAVADWQGRIAQLFVDAKIKNGHAHRMRDTFAAELLLAGVPIERVAVLLGHSSIRITEKYYSAWIAERQAQVERDVMATWTSDPIALLEAKGTSEVHKNSEPVN
jgi:integrase/recombinase XerD